MSTMKVWALAVSLLILMLLVSGFSMYHKTLTYDERDHYAYGEQIWNLNSDRFEDSKMPFSVLNVIPWEGIKHFGLDTWVVGLARRDEVAAGPLLQMTDEAREATLAVLTGRLSTIVVALLLGVYVFLWARSLYGARGGLLALALYTLSPNLIAHSRLVTTDLYAVCMITISTYYFWRFLTYGGYRHAIPSAFTLGLSQLAKPTCVFLVPIFIMVLLVRSLGRPAALRRPNFRKYHLEHLRAVCGYALLFALVGMLAVNAGFLFNRTLVPLREYDFSTDILRSIQSNPLLPGSLRVPFPAPYIEGLDAVRSTEVTGDTFGNIYLLGKIRETTPGFRPFPGYYSAAFLLKVPIAVQVLILMSAVMYIQNRRRFSFLRNEVFLFCPLLFFAVYFNFFFRAQIGIRFFLVVFPFLHVFCGSLVAEARPPGPRLKAIVVALMVYLAVSVASHFPHYISYFNEIVWDRKQAYRFLADSNIDWGQNRYYLERYTIGHPDAILRPGAPITGTVVVAVNDLVGVWDPDKYRWIRDNHEPVGHIAFSYLVYEIPEDSVLRK